MKKRLLIVANNAEWKSWPWKIEALKRWFRPSVEFEINVTHTFYNDIPFTEYASPDNTNGWLGVVPAWYDYYVTPFAYKYDMVLFVIPRSQWKEPNKARGWRGDNKPFGVWKLQISADENEHRYAPGPVDLGEEFFLMARHEILHGLCAITGIHDTVHEWEAKGQLETLLKQFSFIPNPIFIQKMIEELKAKIAAAEAKVKHLRAKLALQKLIETIIIVESGGDDDAIGDTHLAQKAYGPMQIRQPAVDDLNRIYGTNHKAVDCRGNRKLSIDIFKKYIDIYATEQRLGRTVTDEDRSRIWNGGPDGYKRQTTVGYWNKVKTLLA